MIAMILGLILGISGVIQPKDFSAWEWAALIEIIVEFVGVIVVLYIKGSVEEKRQGQRSKAYKAKMRANAKANRAVKEIRFDNFVDVFSGYELDAKNPYAKGTLRYNAFEERRRAKENDKEIV